MWGVVLESLNDIDEPSLLVGKSVEGLDGRDVGVARSEWFHEIHNPGPGI